MKNNLFLNQLLMKNSPGTMKAQHAHCRLRHWTCFLSSACAIALGLLMLPQTGWSNADDDADWWANAWKRYCSWFYSPYGPGANGDKCCDQGPDSTSGPSPSTGGAGCAGCGPNPDAGVYRIQMEMASHQNSSSAA